MISTRRLSLLVIGALLFWSAWIRLPTISAQTYHTPVQPPDGNIAAPLNSSGSTQRLNGSLLIGDIGRQSKLCLNAATGSDPLTTTDSERCISAWSDIGAGGPQYVQLSNNTVTSCEIGSNMEGCFDPNSYTVQNGYVRVRGVNTSNPSVHHAYTTVLEAPQLCQDFNSDGERECAGTPGLSCRYNADCVSASQAGKVHNPALYAGNSATGTNYAGYFRGRTTVYDRLCLNGTDANACIISWADAGTRIRDKYVWLQTPLLPAIQSGGLSVSGTGHLGNTTVGYPGTAALCGDGMCMSGEACSVDCETPIADLAQFTTTGNPGSVRLSFRPANVQAKVNGNSAHVLIVRSNNPNFNAPPPATFVPQPGSLYSTGGNSNFAVVYSQPVPIGTTIQFDDNTHGFLPNTQYFYRAFQANAYPRYSPGLSAIANAGTPTAYQLNVHMIGGFGSDTVIGAVSIVPPSGDGINCQPDCTGTYPTGTEVRLRVTSITQGITFVGWSYGGCSGTGDCVVTLDSSVSVLASFGGGGGGGDGPQEF